MIKVRIHNDDAVQPQLGGMEQPQMPQEPAIPIVKLTHQDEKPNVKVVRPPLETYFLPMNIKKTLEGNVCIYDHPYMDIVVSPSNTKIITFPKDNKMKDTYVTQRDFMEYMKDHGLIKFDSIRGGSLHNSLEATYAVPKDIDVISAILVGIYRYIQLSKIQEEKLVNYENDLEKEYLSPDEEHSTSFEDAVATHKTKKGSIDPKQMAYGLLYRL